MTLATAGLLVIRDRRLLLAYSRNKSCFYLPGGKIDEGETAIAALCREINEEMNVHIDERLLEFHSHVTAPAFGEINGVIMEQDCFILHRFINPHPSAEISEVRYFTLDEYLLEKNRAPGAIMILERLKREGLID
jgi:8-oxo-dGTP pyrophosphatase MutT (NUDIX family)